MCCLGLYEFVFINRYLQHVFITPLLQEQHGQILLWYGKSLGVSSYFCQSVKMPEHMNCRCKIIMLTPSSLPPRLSGALQTEPGPHSGRGEEAVHVAET